MGLPSGPRLSSQVATVRNASPGPEGRPTQAPKGSARQRAPSRNTASGLLRPLATTGRPPPGW
ncbi:DUF6053 domain-containing protein [Lysobacter enzymogenes]|uniref:DUF6053 domain-containing protein n=1 Tax=Lysobacter enzymogenes TaxID=69 RepID=UPI003D18C75A